MKLKFLKMGLNEIVGSVTDGYIARHLNKKEFSNLAKNFSNIKFLFLMKKYNFKISFGLGTPSPMHFITRPFERWLASRWVIPRDCLNKINKNYKFFSLLKFPFKIICNQFFEIKKLIKINKPNPFNLIK